MKTIIDNILIYHDFSDSAFNALHTALQMAKRHNATLHLLYVEDVLNFYSASRHLTTFEPPHDEIMVQKKTAIIRLAAAVKKDLQLSCAAHYLAGIKKQAICNTAERLNCDLLVIGMAENVEQKSYLFDTLAYRVIEQSPCPVLTVPAKKHIGYFKNILFPVRPVSRLLDKYHLANVIAQRNNSKIELLGLMQRDDLTLLKSLKAFVDRLARQMRLDSLRVSSRVVLSQDTTAEVMMTARKHKADLLIINAETDRSFSQYFLGNYTQKMIRETGVAVLCVKQKRSPAAATLRGSLALA